MLNIVFTYVFWFPIVLGLSWLVPAVLFNLRRENRQTLSLNKTPFISIIVPAFNEEKIITNTIKKLNELNYPNFEIIVINDGSTDRTFQIINNLLNKYDRLRIIDVSINEGKANALKLGLLASKGEIVMCIDADSYLDKDALTYILPHFFTPNNSERVGAVNCNLRVRNPVTAIGKIQAIEYVGIISFIKRAQRILGKIITVSGVATAYRKKALIDSGLWDTNVLTEDTAIAWKLQRKNWDIRFESRAIAWTLVPESIFGVLKQRMRWATGVIQALIKNTDIFTDIKQRRLYPLYIEEILTLLWSFCWFISIVALITSQNIREQFLVPYLVIGNFITMFLLIQLITSLVIDHNKGSFIDFLYGAFLPFIYWYLGALTILVSVPLYLLNKKSSWEPLRAKSNTIKIIEFIFITIGAMIILGTITNIFLSIILWFINPQLIYEISIIKESINITAFTFSTTIDLLYFFIFLGITWGIYNKKKFRKKAKQEFPTITTINEVLNAFNIEEKTYYLFQERLVSLENNKNST